MKFSVTILGSGAAIPTLERKPTAHHVNVRGRNLLLDCAEGTQVQLRWLGKSLQKLDYIFISHLHGDHYYGLIGLLTSLHLLGRKKELLLFGPAGLKEIIDIQLTYSHTTLVYPLVIKIVKQEKPETILDDGQITVTAFPLKHSIPTWGYLIREHPLKRKIRKDFVNSHSIPVEEFKNIISGSDFTDATGNTHRNEDITFAPLPPRSYAFCTDTAYHEDIIPVIRGVDLLYHEATFAQAMADDARDKLHSTVKEAALIAKKAGAGRLLIGHFSARYKESEVLLKEAEEVFPDTLIASDGMEIEI